MPKADPEVAPDTLQGAPSTLRWAFRYAFRGIAEAFKSERNMKIHGVVAVFALIAAAFLRVDVVGWALIILCIAIVFSGECFNTALEALVDLVTDEYAPLARVAKDCAAGAVLICAIASVIVGLSVYIPALVRLVSG